jgi:hypothetical protein
MTTDINNTLDERGKRYGTFIGHASVTQLLKAAFFEHRKLQGLPPMAPDQEEAIDMIMHKLGRIANGDANYADSWVDIAGYAKLVSDRLEGVTR